MATKRCRLQRYSQSSKDAMNLVGRLQEYWKYRSERDSLPITCDLALEFNEKDTRILIGNRHEGRETAGLKKECGELHQ